MKRLLSIMICCLMTALCHAGADVDVRSGNIAIFNVQEKAELVVDYSVAKVNDMTLDAYLKSRGEDFVRDWPSDEKKAKEYFIVRFNKKNKKGLQITETGSSSYKIVFQVKTLDMGNGGSSFIPFASAKAGGVIVSGLMEVINKSTGKSVCCLEVDDVKGLGHPSETVRLGMAYFELASKVLKEAKGADDTDNFTETEPITVAGGAVKKAKTSAAKATNGAAASVAKTATSVAKSGTKTTRTAAKTTRGKASSAKASAKSGKATTAQTATASQNTVDETISNDAKVKAMLANAKGQQIQRRRKPVLGNFENIANQSRIGAYLDFSNAEIDGRTESEFIKYMETTADDDDLDPEFGEKWESIKSSLASTVTAYVNKKLKSSKQKLRFASTLDTDYILKMEVVSVDDDGNNKVNYLFVNVKTGEVEAQITCESKGGHFGRYAGLLKQGFESGGEDLADKLLEKID